MDTIEKVKFPDKKWIKIVKKLFNGEIKDFTDLDKLDINRALENNNSLKISNKKEKNNKTLDEALTKDMRLLNLLSLIKQEIIKNNINLDELFNQLDKKKNGKLSFNEFKKLFDKLIIENINEEDIAYIMIHLDTDKDGNLQYKEFLNLLN